MQPYDFMRGLLAFRLKFWAVTFATFLLLPAPLIWALPASTTTLLVASGGSAATGVSSGSVVVLTAAVVSPSGSAVSPGRVKFCDAGAKYCTGSHLLATAQLTSAGTAVYRFVPGIGSKSYKAVFVGTKSVQGSASGAVNLSVTGTQPSGASITQSSFPGSYTLKSTVGGNGIAEPGGSVSFVDTSGGNAVLGTAPLEAAKNGLGLVNSANPVVESPGQYPYQVATADFNGDGFSDIATLVGNTVVVTLGNGDGTFKASGPVGATGNDPVALATGDFNSDGIPDIAVVNNADNDVTILLGNGDGSFTATAVSPATCSAPSGLAVEDFNGDGVADLAVLCNQSSTGQVSILIGTGSGAFTSLAALSTPAYPLSMVTADFNGDGTADLAILDGIGYAGEVAIYSGNGDGTFTALANSLLVDSFDSALITTDFNGDGIADLAVTDSNGTTVTILTGKGDGRFLTKALTVGEGVTALAAADLNGDGVPDLAVLAQASVLLYTGNGDGTFLLGGSGVVGSSGSLPSNIFAFAVSAADLNGDGIADLAVQTETPAMISALLVEKHIATATVTGIATIGPDTNVVTANYAGNSSYAPATSGPINLYSSTRAVPKVTLMAASNPMAFPASTLTMLVTGSRETPTGTVRINQVPSYADQTSLYEGMGSLYINELGVGQYAITATYEGDDLYEPATSAELDLVITKGPQTINFPTVYVVNPYDQFVPVTYGSTFTLRAGASSNLPVSYKLTGPGTLSGSSVTATAVGTLGATAYQDGNAEWEPAKPVGQSIPVRPAPLTVTAQNVSRAQGAPNPTFTYTLTGFVNGDTSAAVSGAPVLSTTATADSPPGQYSIVVMPGTLAASNYAFRPVFGTLTVTGP